MKRKMILCRFLALILAGAWFSSVAYASDNSGNEFLLTFINGANSPSAEIHLTGNVDTTVEIEYPVGTSYTTANVVAGNVTVVDLPVSTMTGSDAVRLHSSNDFVVYMLSLDTYTSDASLALPVDALGTDYISVGYIPSGSSTPGLIAIAATQDGTMVDIDGTTVNLNRGEVHRIDTGAQEPSGKRITSNFPVAVTSGDKCTNIPPGVSACDTIFQMLTPVSGWGRTVSVAPLPVSNRPNGAIYRIYAAEDGSVIRQDGVDITTLNANEFVEIPQLTGAHVFSSDNPIYVMQYMTGISDSGASNGDPFMVNIPPAGQYLNFYTFSTVEGNFTEHYLNIIANNADIGSLTLDGSVVTGFTAISGTDLSYVTLSLSVGVHQTSSANPHGIVVLGLGEFNSYSYAGGQSFNPINTFYTLTIDPPTNGTVTSNGSIDCGSTCEEVVQFGLVTLTATPDSGYEFVSWGGNCSGTDNPLNFTIATDMTCSATFQIPSLGLPSAGVDHTTSLGKFGIRLTQAKGQELLGVDFCPGDPTDPAHDVCLFESPVLFDTDTSIGRSHPHLDADVTDETNGAQICGTGSSATCTNFLSDTVKDSDFAVVPDTGIFAEGPSGTTEIHTQILSFNMIDSGNCNGVSANAIRAGSAVPDPLPRSIGEVESLNVDGFPAESFFDVFVEVDVDWDMNGSVDMTVININPLVIQNDELNNLPPTVVYIHGGGENAPAVYDRATGEMIGWITIAGHGIGLDCTDNDDLIMFTDHYDNMVEQVNVDPPATLATLIVTTPSNGAVTSNGAIDCGGTCTEELLSGWPVTLSAIPDSGSQFVSWGGDCSGTDNPLNFTLTADMTCSATFETSSTTHTLTVTTPSHGSVTSNGAIDCGNTCTEELSSGSPVTLTAVPDSGYQFVSWAGDCSGTNNPLNFNLTADMTCSASFGITTLVTLLDLTATASYGAVTIVWETATEFDNAGFVVWRGQLNADKTECSLNGEDYTEVKQISPFIWAQGEAASYSYQDTQVESGNTYCYALEDVDFYGTSTYHLNNIASATVQ